MTEKLTKGLVQVYTGNGKGKTTAAFGQAIRAYGAGLRVCIVQFLKDGSSAEVTALRTLAPEIVIICCGEKGFIDPSGPFGRDKDIAATGLASCKEIMAKNEADVLVLDEICTAVSLGVIEEGALLQLLKLRPAGVEVILTGRGASPGIISAADLVTEMREVKHPFARGERARKGVEY